MAFIEMFVSSREVFGQSMPAEMLLTRVQSYGWKQSITRLAQLAAFIDHPSRKSEEITARTVDPVLSITGDERARRLVANARTFVGAHRNKIRIAHEEVISYLQHLVLVEGGDGDECPSDAELVFWMLGANCHLGEWSEPDNRALSVDEQLIAAQVRGHCFNKEHHWAALAVRSYDLFRNCPEDESLGGHEAWCEMQLKTFGAPFSQYYCLILAPLLAVAWRAGEHSDGMPSVGLEYWKNTTADAGWIHARLDAISVTRDVARREILDAARARDGSGLLHAPTLLRRKPLIADESGGFLITSPQAIAMQFHTGPWGAYLAKAKSVHGDNVGFMRWSSAFGIAFERYCAQLATMAGAAPKFRRNWRILLPSAPGASDEIEDVILTEDDHAVLFSIKSTLLPEGAVHRAKSQSAVLDWLERFLFADDPSFKGAVRKLNTNIDEIRAGDFETQGISRHVKILPVLVTYDKLGEDVLLYQRLRRRCRESQLLMQAGVAPLTIAAIDEYEWMMEYVREGRSLVGVLKKRKSNQRWFDRRVDQQQAQVQPRVQYGYIERRFGDIFGEVLSAVRPSAGHSPSIEST